MLGKSLDLGDLWEVSGKSTGSEWEEFRRLWQQYWAPIGQNKLGDFLDFVGFLVILYGICGF